MPLAIDAHAISGQQGGSSATLTITTTGTSDIILVAIWEGATDTAAWAVADTQGHLSFNRRYPVSSATSTLFTIFYATATAALTSDGIQVSGSPGADWGFAVIAISGVNTSTPLDLAATAVGSNTTNPSVTYSTSNANDMLVGWIYNGSNAANPGLGSGYSPIDNANWSNVGWEADEYRNVSSSGSQSTGWSGGVSGFPYAEAIEAAAASVPNLPLITQQMPFVPGYPFQNQTVQPPPATVPPQIASWVYEPMQSVSYPYLNLTVQPNPKPIIPPTIPSWVYEPLQRPARYGVDQRGNPIGPTPAPVLGSWVYEPMQQVFYPIFQQTVQPPALPPSSRPTVASWVYEEMQRVENRYLDLTVQPPFLPPRPPMAAWVFEPMQQVFAPVLDLTVKPPSVKIIPPVLPSYVYEMLQPVETRRIDLTIQPPFPTPAPPLASWVYEPVSEPRRYDQIAGWTGTLRPFVPTMGSWVYEPMQPVDVRSLDLTVQPPTATVPPLTAAAVYEEMQRPRITVIYPAPQPFLPIAPIMPIMVFTPMQTVMYPVLDLIVQPPHLPIIPPKMGSYVYEPMQRVPLVILDLTVKPPPFPRPPVVPTMGSWVYEELRRVHYPVLQQTVQPPLPTPTPPKVVRRGSTLFVLGAG